MPKSSLPTDGVGRERPRQAFLILDRAGRVVHVSSSLFAMLRVAPATAVLEQSFLVLFSCPSVFDANMQLALQQWMEISMNAGANVTPLNLLTAVAERAFELDLKPLGELYQVLTIEDVTIAPAAEHVPAALALRDHLTGLGNRVLFEQELTLRLLPGANSTGAIVLFLDLDRFKIVNDTLGHAVGDELLRLVSQRLQTTLRPSDILARMGGDEFAILLAQPADKDNASSIAGRILDLIQRTYLIDGQVVNVGASIGIAVGPEDGSAAEQLLKSADLALYFSKAAGRGVWHFFAPEMQERAQQRRALELDLRKALVLRQFELHYQPQIDVSSQNVTGVEALLRWRHPSRGLLLPEDFIAVAEEIGLMLPLGDWVLRTACREALRWPETTTVAVNVSPLQFESGKFIESVTRALATTGLPGPRLEIELTEDILQRNSQLALKTLQDLQALGVRTVMGSFGTGLASLSRLVNFPFDKIKINRAVIGLHQEADIKGRAIVRAISALGHSLGIATLAEGVETLEQLTKVQAEGCQSVQGFYYSQAVPAEELSALLGKPFTAPVPAPNPVISEVLH